MKRFTWIVMAAMVALAGCDQPTGIVEEPTFTLPDLQLGGKADGGSSNVSWGPGIERGAVRGGFNSGYVAMPINLEANDPLLLQAWTDRPSVVFVYGPNRDGKWDMEQVRQISRNLELGVEGQFFQLNPVESGEYLVIVGALSGNMTEWIVAWADESLDLD